MNRRKFLAGIGLFTILPGAGRIWRATIPELTPWQKLPTIVVEDYPPFQTPCHHRVFTQEYWDMLHKIMEQRVGIPKDQLTIFISPDKESHLREFFGLTNEQSVASSSQSQAMLA